MTKKKLYIAKDNLIFFDKDQCLAHEGLLEAIARLDARLWRKYMGKPSVRPNLALARYCLVNDIKVIVAKSKARPSIDEIEEYILSTIDGKKIHEYIQFATLKKTLSAPLR